MANDAQILCSTCGLTNFCVSLYGQCLARHFSLTVFSSVQMTMVVSLLITLCLMMMYCHVCSYKVNYPWSWSCAFSNKVIDISFKAFPVLILNSHNYKTHRKDTTEKQINLLNIFEFLKPKLPLSQALVQTIKYICYVFLMGCDFH